MSVNFQYELQLLVIYFEQNALVTLNDKYFLKFIPYFFHAQRFCKNKDISKKKKCRVVRIINIIYM